MIDSGTISFFSGKLIIGTLLFIRILGMMTAAPMFRSTAIPRQLKVILAVILAFSLTSAFWKEQPVIDFHLWYLVLLVLKEFMVGVAIGFAANTVFWAARTAGGLIDFDMGYHTSALFNMEEGSPTMVGELIYMATLMVFLFLNGHHYLIEGVWASVRAVPITTFEVSESTIMLLIKMATSIFVIALKMSAPLLVALFLTNLALALLARVAPQTNIFILSFQLKIVVGLIVMFASIPLMILISKYALEGMETEMMRFLLTLNPSRV
jgi:flagellar biosynthesis protein FliR